MNLLPLHIASRYLLSKKAHNAVNIITLVATLGVVITTAALVVVLSVYNGFYGVIQDKLAKLDPPIAVAPVHGKTIASADSLISAFKQIPQVETAMPVLEDQALAVFADFQMPLRVKGVPVDYHRLTAIDSVIVDGEPVLRDEVASYAIVGVGPAVTLRLRAGSIRMLQLYVPEREATVNPANPVDAFYNDSLFVSAVFQVQQNSYDNDLIYVPLDFARNLFNRGDEASQIEVKLKPGSNEEQVMARLQAVAGDRCTVKNRMMQQAEAFRLVNIEKWMTFLLLAFIMLIAAFNIISTLALLIIEKDDSIKTLSFLGADKKLITRVFVAEGWLITMTGAVAGIVLGLALSLGQQHFGWLKINADPTQLIVSAYPVAVVWTDVAVVLALVALVALATSAVTAWTMHRRLKQ